MIPWISFILERFAMGSMDSIFGRKVFTQNGSSLNGEVPN